MEIYRQHVVHTVTHEAIILLSKKEIAALMEVIGPKKGPKSARVLWVDFTSGSVTSVGRCCSVRVTGNPYVEVRSSSTTTLMIDAERVAALAKGKTVTHVAIATATVPTQGFIAACSDVALTGVQWESVRDEPDVELMWNDVWSIWSPDLDDDANGDAKTTWSTATEFSSLIAKVGAAADTDEVTWLAPNELQPLRVIAAAGNTQVAAMVRPLDPV